MRRILLGAALLLAGCAQQPDHRAEAAPPETVSSVDLKRYQGLWYELARYPNRFEDDGEAGPCVGVTAEYALREDGTLRVVNSCRQGSLDGPLDVAEGTARRVGPGRLEVKFAPSWVPFAWGDYWVLALEDDYSAALVGSPDGKYLWVLSRTPSLPPETYDRLLGAAAAEGYDVAALRPTPQAAPDGRTRTGRLRPGDA